MNSTEILRLWAKHNALVVREVTGVNPKKGPPGRMRDAAGHDVVITDGNGKRMPVTVLYSDLDQFVADGLAKEGWGDGANLRVYTLTERGRAAVA